MTREEVYKLIDGERDYQNTDPHDAGHDDDEQHVADWLIFIEEHLKQAKREIYNLNKPGALEQVRKIAALTVACMEHNNTLPRRQ